jgi:CheY-like chemotaxis protein
MGAPPIRTSLRGVAVLVVDDDRDTVEVLTTSLRQAGALVMPCRSAEDALAYCQFARPDVVVTDIMMPGRDGYWLLRELKSRFRKVPVVAITAWGGRERALDAGFTRYISKPFDPLALRDTLEALVTHR